MKPSPLQLTDYFLSELHFTANSRFDAKKEVNLTPDDFQLSLEARPSKDERRKWQVILKLRHQPPAEANVPCRFTIETVGSFLVLAEFPAERIERLVRTNGPSMLYGILREVVRDITGRGPYLPPILLPSASFYEPEAAYQPASPPMAEVKEPPPPAPPMGASEPEA